jgi:sensor histidine kinase YesM
LQSLRPWYFYYTIFEAKKVQVEQTANKTFSPSVDFVRTPGGMTTLLNNRWAYHSLFWIVYYLFLCLIFYSAYEIHEPVFYFQFIVFMPFSAALVYFNVYVLIPRLVYRRRYVSYIFSLAVALLISALINQLLKKMYVHFGSLVFAYTSDMNFKNIFTEMIGLFYLTGFTTGIKLTKDWIQNQRLMKEREKQYLETELNFLKTQIHPHFFFNTLNNLYSLTLKKSDLAPEVVLKLSSLMSYMLYESNAAKVSLAKEIAYLQNYLDLEKLRFGQRLTVVFEMEGQIDEVNIPPMILILFVENSFKHGVKNNVNHIQIDVSLKIKDGYLFFEVKNPVGNRSSTDNEGIGLKNAKRRLELLYGTNYKLDISEKEGLFFVNLKMPVG